MHHPTDRITHTTAFVTPVVEHWLEREIAQCSSLLNLRCNVLNINIERGTFDNATREQNLSSMKYECYRGVGVEG